MMQLFSEITGNGQNLVLLHGWGMHGGVWHDMRNSLSESMRVHCLDLPGHGASQPMTDRAGLKSFTSGINDYISSLEEPVTLLGWSLGGILAMNSVLSGNSNIEKLILVATTPCFTQRNDWQCAMPAQVFNGFVNDLEQDYAVTLKKFIALQCRGSEREKELLREMRQVLAAKPAPSLSALQAGLHVLQHTDLRQQLSRINLPVLCIAGGRDTLVPVQAMTYLAQQLDAELMMIDKAGHAPFISHSSDSVDRISEFVHAG